MFNFHIVDKGVPVFISFSTASSTISRLSIEILQYIFVSELNFSRKSLKTLRVVVSIFLFGVNVMSMLETNTNCHCMVVLCFDPKSNS